MKRILWLSVLAIIAVVANSQPVKKTSANNTLLWRISGKNIVQPSYLFGTMHMLCADDIDLSDSLVNAIRKADNV
jgi:uncharacterized protein